MATGLALLVWGWTTFLEEVPPPLVQEEEGYRFEAPTLSELVELGPARRKLSGLAVAMFSMTMIGASVSVLFAQRSPG